MSIMIHGKNPCKEILTTEKPVMRAFLEKGANADLIPLLKKKGIEIVTMEKNDFNGKFQGTHQGIALEIADYKLLSLEEALKKHQDRTNPVFLMLDGITDPHNLGAIIRSAEAGGVSAIIYPKNRSVGVTGTVAKVASGSLEYMDLVEVTNLTQTVEKLKKQGFWIVGTDMDGTKNYSDIDVSTPLCVIIGGEGKGISRLLKETADFLVRIPMVGHVNSLNASVSAGIVIFEILRKKGF